MNSEAHKISVKRQHSLKLSRTFFLLCSVDKRYIRASLSGSRCSQPLSELIFHQYNTTWPPMFTLFIYNK
jgi:hypothetical protein